MTKIKKLSDETHRRVLGRKSRKWSEDALDKASIQWADAGLADAEDPTTVVEMPLIPEIEHWEDVAMAAVDRYGSRRIALLDKLAVMELPTLPPVPPATPGWQVFINGEWVEQTVPDGTTLILDFETVQWGTVQIDEDDEEQVTHNAEKLWLPVCACGLTLGGRWVVWQYDPPNLTTVVPFARKCTVIGHNVPYDRQWLAPEYHYQDSGNRFWDTMAAWIATRGISNQQRSVLKMGDDALRPLWVEETTTNGLDAVHKFYTGKDLDKGVRDNLIADGMRFVKFHMAEVLHYCFKDVLATLLVFQHLYPEFKRHRPHPVSQTAQFLLGSCWIPLSTERWDGFYDRVERLSSNVKLEIDQMLATRIEQVLNENPEDTQLKYLNWTPATSGKNKGFPQWYRDILSNRQKLQREGKQGCGLTLNSKATPLLLGLHWRNEPVIPLPTESSWGWGTESYGLLPHPEERGKRVTQLFAKGFNHAVEEGLLTTSHGNLTKLLKDAMSLVNWTSLRKRVAAVHTESPEGYPVVLPQLTVTGTITGRCADNLWQVLPNPKKTRVGTELKTMVEAPPGYMMVGADVDSQEAWIASALGDQILRYCGSTAFSLSILVGDKDKETDIHSLAAAKSTKKRDPAKNLVYGTLYGQGLKGAIDLLLKALPELSYAECSKLAHDFLNSFKGSISNYSGLYTGGLASDAFNQLERYIKKPGQPTPVLGCRISESLAHSGKDYKTTKINRIIQASGVDFRDLLVVYQRYFFDVLGIDGRLVMTIHDEIRTVVKEGQEVLAAYALQLSHLLTRAAFIDRLDLDCIPASCAWFSEVDIDRYLRKSPKETAKTSSLTPTQTMPLVDGYSLKPAEILQKVSLVL